MVCSAEVIRVTGSEFTHKKVSESRLRSYVGFLCDSICAGRATGSKGAGEATAWVARQFRSLGLQTTVRSFRTATGAIGRNVLGFMPGANKEQYLIIAAHYDGLGRLDGKMYPGADSDASGVAAMLGVGAMMKEMVRIGKTWRKSVIFIALDGKNAGLSGSAALWKMLSEGSITDPTTGQPVRAGQVALMVNIDQVGSRLSPVRKDKTSYLIMLSAGPADYHRGALRKANERYAIGLDLGMDYYGSRDFTRMFYERVSDQKPFVENGRQAVMFTSGITMNNNKTWDSPETLDYTLLKKRIWLIFHWIERVI